jgi:hypothetical protein
LFRDQPRNVVAEKALAPQKGVASRTIKNGTPESAYATKLNPSRDGGVEKNMKQLWFDGVDIV